MSKEKIHGAGYKYPSVTTILGVLRKIGLENWFKYNTAQYCDEKSRKGKEIGTAIHDAIFNHIERTGIDTETQYPDEVGICIQSFMRFKNEHPEIVLSKSEMPIEHGELKYSGTLDCVAKINDELVILDWKSGECKDKEKPAIYEDYFYQAAAYIKAYEYMNKCSVQKGVIVSIAKDKVAYGFREMSKEMIDISFDSFIHCLGIYNNQKKVKEWLQ